MRLGGVLTDVQPDTRYPRRASIRRNSPPPDPDIENGTSRRPGSERLADKVQMIPQDQAAIQFLEAIHSFILGSEPVIIRIVGAHFTGAWLGEKAQQAALPAFDDLKILPWWSGTGGQSLRRGGGSPDSGKRDRWRSDRWRRLPESLRQGPVVRISLVQPEQAVGRLQARSDSRC